jgi:hypothetical protein
VVEESCSPYGGQKRTQEGAKQDIFPKDMPSVPYFFQPGPTFYFSALPIKPSHYECIRGLKLVNQSLKYTR